MEHSDKTSEGKYERTGKTTSRWASLWQEVLEGPDFSKGNLLGVRGYLKEWHWPGSQYHCHQLNELIVTSITKSV